MDGGAGGRAADGHWVWKPYDLQDSTRSSLAEERASSIARRPVTNAGTGQIFGEAVYPIAHGPQRARAVSPVWPLSRRHRQLKENGAAIAFASTGIGFDVTDVPLAEDTALINAGLDLSLGASTPALACPTPGSSATAWPTTPSKAAYLAVLTAVLDASLRRHQSPLRVSSTY